MTTHAARGGGQAGLTGGKAIMAPGSVGEAAAMMLKMVAELGHPDPLVNNARTPGTRRRIAPAQLELITDELWATLLKVNLLGVFRYARAATPSVDRHYQDSWTKRDLPTFLVMPTALGADWYARGVGGAAAWEINKTPAAVDPAKGRDQGPLV